MAGPEANPLDLEHQGCFALAARSAVGLYRPLPEPMGLAHPQYLVMLALREHESVRRLSELLLLLLDPATLSPLLKRLGAHSYLSRPRDPADERALRVELTKTGRVQRHRAAPDIPPAITGRPDRSRDDLEALHATLTAATAVATTPGRPPG